MALVPLTALSAFDIEFSLPPLQSVVGVCDPFFSETPVKAYRRPTRKRGRCDDKTIKKLPSAFYFAHEPLDKKDYPAKIKRPQTGLINQPVKKSVRDKDSDEEESENSDSDFEGEKDEDKEEMLPTPNGRNARVEGGRPAAARKITANLDSDDEILVSMKLQGRPDKEIADTLINMGRVKYNIKTIGSRWKRLRIALAKALDEELDKNIAKWSAEEDTLLLQAFDLADQTVTRLKKEADDSRWTIVAQKLKMLKPNALYSIKACRERHEALENGTAALPGLDRDNPEQHVIEQNNGETNAELMEVDIAIPVRSMAKDDVRSLSGNRFVVDEDEVLGNEESHLSDAEGDLAELHDSQPFSLAGMDLSAITNLPFKAQVASAGIGCKALNLGTDLKEIEKMNRDELRQELRLRGLCSDGLRPKMEATLRAARAGRTDLKHSPKNAMTIKSNPLGHKSGKKRPTRRFSAIALSDSEEIEDKEDGAPKDLPQHKRVRIGGSPKIAENVRGSVPENRSSQVPSLADYIFGYLYLPVTDTNGELVYQKEVDDGCRVFLSNVPSTFTADAIRTILNGYSVTAVHTLRIAGHLVVDCADAETALSVTTALDGLALKGETIVVENAQVVAQKYFARRIQAPSADALSAHAPSTLTTGSVSYTPKPLPKSAPTRQLVVKNVPHSVDALQLQQIFGRLSACQRIEPGVWLMEFSDVASARECFAKNQGHYVYGQALELKQALLHDAERKLCRQTKNEGDMYDNGL